MNADDFAAMTPMLSTSALVALLTLGAMLVATAYTELKDGRIPNWITVPGLAIGLVTGYLPGGISLSQSLTGLGVGGGFLFLFYMFGGMGGGDVKLMGAVGALVGYPMVLTVLTFTAFLGGFLAIGVLIWNRRALRRVLRFLVRSSPEGHDEIEAEAGQDGAEKPSVPYGLAIIGGCLVTIFLST